MDLSKKPGGFMFYQELMGLYLAIKDDAVRGRVLREAISFFLSRECDDSGLSGVDLMVLENSKRDILRSEDEYRKKQRTGFRNNPPRANRVQRGDPSSVPRSGEAVPGVVASYESSAVSLIADLEDSEQKKRNEQLKRLREKISR